MKEILEKVLKENNINYTQSQINQLAEFNAQLVDANKHFNLTRITNDYDFAEKHILDSITASIFIDKNLKVADIGAGGGFPSIPLKIMRPDLSFVLVDSVNKKVDFLNQTIKNLNLKQIKAEHARVEDFARNELYRENFDVCVARAVAELRTLLEYTAPLVKKNGLIIAYKGSSASEEIKLAQNAIKVLNLELINDYEYQIQAHTNHLLVFKKIERTNNQFPRRNNKPRKEPL